MRRWLRRHDYTKADIILLDHDTNLYNTFESGSNQLTFQVEVSIKLMNRRMNSKILMVMVFCM